MGGLAESLFEENAMATFGKVMSLSRACLATSSRAAIVSRGLATTSASSSRLVKPSKTSSSAILPSCQLLSRETRRPGGNALQVRFKSDSSLAELESRVLTVVKAFDKILADKVSLESHFINDLGLDSLDHVEVIMAIEDEFGLEIPDDHAEKLLTPSKIAQYVCDHEKIFS